MAPRSKSGAAPMLHGVLSDIGLPLATYYGLHMLGASDYVALLASALVAAVRTVWTAVSSRHLNAFSALMLVVFGVGFLLTFVSGDPRVMILKNSAVTLAVGGLFLLTTFVGRPLTLSASKAWQPEEADEIDRSWDTDPAARRAWRLTAAVWGVGMILEATVRVVLTFQLPVDVMVGLSEALWIGAVILLVAWTRWFQKRIEARTEAAGEPGRHEQGHPPTQVPAP